MSLECKTGAITTGRRYNGPQVIFYKRLDEVLVAFDDLSRNISGTVEVFLPSSRRDLEAQILKAYDREDYEID